MILTRATWYLKQLLPLRYQTYYLDSDDCPHYTTWRMWLGRCYNVLDLELVYPPA